MVVAVLGRWVDALPRELTISHVFVDDRLLIDSSSAALQELLILPSNGTEPIVLKLSPKLELLELIRPLKILNGTLTLRSYGIMATLSI